MFRRFFRIGFGGCGCALEEHFRDHAADLAYDLLHDIYLEEKLKKWTVKLPREPFETGRAGIISELIKKKEAEKEDYANNFFGKKLDNINEELESWYKSLISAKGISPSYEDAIIDELARIITEMEREVNSIKNRGGVLLQSLPVDSFTKTAAEKYKRFYTYNQNITETRELIIEQFGHAVIESQGFNHRPELQMLPFSIKEVRDEVFRKIREHITNEKLSSLTSQGYFFYVGLGGGTGTGVISPLAEKFGKGSYGYFALAVLGAKVDNDRMKSQQPWFRRCFNMLIALNDLIVTAELDGLILVDNARLIQAVDEDEEQGKRENPKTQGKPLVEVEEQHQEIFEQKQTAKMEQPDETPSDGLKGTPLMTEVDEKLIRALYPAFGITSLENEDYDLDWSQLKEHIGLDTLENKPHIIVPCYASGPCSASEDNLEKLIDDALPDPNGPRCNGMLAPCEWKINNELIPKKVFVYVRCIKDEDKLRKKLADKFAPNEENEEVKFATNNIAIIKDYLFCWDDVVETEDYTELKRFLKDEDLCNIYWADEAVPGKKDKDTLVFCKKKSNECVTLQIGRQLFDWIDGKIENYEELKRYFGRNKISWIDPTVSDKKIIIGKDETKAELTFDEKSKEVTLSWGKPRQKHVLDVKEEDVKEDNKRRQGIYEPNEVEITIPGRKKGDVPLLGVKRVKKNGKDMRHLYLKGCDSSIRRVKTNLEKKIVVFESQEIGTFWHKPEKENEVLILLVNPGVREALEERLTEALKFVNLLVTFKELLEASTEDKLVTANKIIEGNIGTVTFRKSVDGKSVDELKQQLEGILKDISDVGIDKKSDRNGKKLEEARDFLLPRELYEKDKNIYEYMKGVLERLEKESTFLSDYLEGTREWPIFREKIFNIISTSGKRDEVVLSAISAMSDETEKRFDKLVGDAYASYLGTFQRQFFKYNPSYLYHSMDNILSDNAEDLLPEDLKTGIKKAKQEEIDERISSSGEQSLKKFEERRKEELVKLVKGNLNKPARLFSILAEDKGEKMWDQLRESWDNDHKDLKARFIQNKVIPSKTVYVPGKYLFEWGKCPGEDDERFRDFLVNDCTISGAQTATIRKEGDNIVITNSQSETVEHTIILCDANVVKLDSTLLENLKVKEDKRKRYVYKVDDNERTMINIEEDAEKIYSIKKGDEGIVVYGPIDLSFPAMLALAGLYADWQDLLIWNESIENPVDNQSELIKQLFENENGKQLPTYGVDFEISASSKAKDNEFDKIPNLLIIDEEKEKATLIARRSSGVLFNWIPDRSPDLTGEIPPDLVERFDKERHPDVNPSKGWGLEGLEGDTVWRLHSKDSNTYYYLTKKGEKQFVITGDRDHELKVKVEEVREGSKAEKKSKRLKIYKKRGEYFKAAEADGEAKNE